MSDATKLLPRAAAAPKSPTPADPPPPVLISLPCGLDLGGVTTWAVNLAQGLARRGGHVVMVTHPREEAAGRPEAQVEIARTEWAAGDERGEIKRIKLEGVPPLTGAAGDLSPYLPAYRDALRSLYRQTGRPAVYLPNQVGDSFGIAAALCVAEPELLRIVAWQHADTPYDTALLERYEPVIHRFIAIDEEHARALRVRLPWRGSDVVSVPHGVVVPDEPPADREPLDLGRRPVRLVYTGRLEHPQKRISAYPLLADELTRRGVLHEIVLVGDGPAAAEIDGCAASRPSLRRVPACDMAEVVRWLEWGDCFVLASRYEGLCLSRIEAMARGCVPIVTRINSGAATGLRDGVSGLTVPTRPEDSPEQAARDLADAVERFCALGERAVGDMRLASWHDARAHFSNEQHIDGVMAVLNAAEHSPPRFWPACRPAAFSSTGDGAASGSVPADGAVRLRELLEQLRGRRVLLHGCGRHTVELAGVLAAHGDNIVALSDDDPIWWSGVTRKLFGWPVVAPQHAAASGATDVVISSWLHAEAIWARRSVYERQGLRVHRLYDASTAVG